MAAILLLIFLVSLLLVGTVVVVAQWANVRAERLREQGRLHPPRPLRSDRSGEGPGPAAA
jgi:hypothetical protein